MLLAQPDVGCKIYVLLVIYRGLKVANDSSILGLENGTIMTSIGRHLFKSDLVDSYLQPYLVSDISFLIEQGYFIVLRRQDPNPVHHFRIKMQADDYCVVEQPLVPMPQRISFAYDNISPNRFLFLLSPSKLTVIFYPLPSSTSL